MRQKTELDKGWRFASTGSSEIVQVDLPHAWTDAGSTHEQNAAGPGLCVYMRTFTPDAAQCSGALFLELWGVSVKCDVFLDGRLLGTHIGAATVFRFDITRRVKAGRTASLRLVVSNKVKPLRSDGLVPRGGIFGGVRLIAAPKSHFTLSDLGSDGIYVTPEILPDGSASIKVDTKIQDPVNYDIVNYDLIAPDGTVAANAVAAPKDPGAVLRVDKPVRWDTTSLPFMYTLRASIVRDGVPLDSLDVQFGIRTIDIDADGFFSVNGEVRQPLFGTVFDRLAEHRDTDTDLVKAAGIGCNILKLGPECMTRDEIFDIADRRGLLLWSDLGLRLVDEEHTADEFKTLRIELEEYIKQTYNHPSIAFREVWSSIPEQIRLKFANLLSGISNYVSSLSKNCFTACCEKCGDTGLPAGSPCDIMCVRVPYDFDNAPTNNVSRWIDEYRSKAQRPRVAVICDGAPADGTGGKRNYDERTQAVFHETFWQRVGAKVGIFAIFAGPLFDDPGQDTPEGRSLGLITGDRTHFRQAYYYYQARLGHEHFVKIADNDTSCADRLMTLRAYSDCQTLRLTVNDRDKKAVTLTGSSGIFIFRDVRLVKGKNHITVSGTDCSDEIFITV